MTDLDKRFLADVTKKLPEELERLRRCGAITDTTALCDVYSVALYNLANNYSNRDSKNAKNLLKF